MTKKQLEARVAELERQIVEMQNQLQLYRMMSNPFYSVIPVVWPHETPAPIGPGVGIAGVTWMS